MLQCFEIESYEKLHNMNYLDMQTFHMYLDHYEKQTCLEKVGFNSFCWNLQ